MNFPRDVPLLGAQPVGLQTLLSVLAVQQPDGKVAPLTLRDLYILVIATAVLGRESATAQPGGDLARFSVAMADALLQARAGPEPSRSIPAVAPPGPAGGGS